MFFKGNIDFFDKVYQMVQPPRVLLLGGTAIITIFYGIIKIINIEILNSWFYYNVCEWLLVFTIVFVAFIFSIPRKFWNKNTLIAVLTLPKAFFIMGLSLLKLRGANKKFIHTTHGTED